MKMKGENSILVAPVPIYQGLIDTIDAQSSEFIKEKRKFYTRSPRT